MNTTHGSEGRQGKSLQERPLLALAGKIGFSILLGLFIEQIEEMQRRHDALTTGK